LCLAMWRRLRSEWLAAPFRSPWLASAKRKSHVFGFFFCNARRPGSRPRIGPRFCRAAEDPQRLFFLAPHQSNRRAADFGHADHRSGWSRKMCAKFGRIGWKSLLYFEVITTIAIVRGEFASINITRAGEGIMLPRNGRHHNCTAIHLTIEGGTTFILHIFPEKHR